MVRHVCEGCGVMRYPCGMCWCWCVCAYLGLLLLAWLCDGCVVYVSVVVGLLLCCLPMVGVMGDSMWAQLCCMMFLAVYRCMSFVLDMPCCGMLMFFQSNCLWWFRVSL